MIARIWNYLIDAITSPREQLTNGQTTLRKLWHVAGYGYRQLSHHRAEGMAAELSYRTIFSLVPLVVLGLVTFRIVGGLDGVQSQVETQLYQFFGVPEIPDDFYIESPIDSDDNDPAGRSGAIDGSSPGADDRADPVDPAEPAEPSTDDPSGDEAGGQVAGDIAETAIQGTVQDDPAVTPPAAADQNEPVDVVQSDVVQADAVQSDDVAEAKGAIQRTLREVTSKVSSIDFKSIGVVGLLLFIYAAVALADSVEQLFNRIFDAPSGRPIHLRLAIHWSIITLGSGLLTMSLYLSNQAVDWVGQSGYGATGQNIASHVLSILASWVLLFLVYALMPNTWVSLPAAATGSIVASLLWEAAKFGFAIYVNRALPYSALYGSIGLIPLFLFWIYVTWLIILFGLVLTQVLQEYHGEVPTRDQESIDDAMPKGDPDWMLPIMAEIYMSFDRGEAISHQRLGDRIGLSSRVVHDMTSRLIDKGLLRRVGVGPGDEEGLTLARPAEKISIAEILSIAHSIKPLAKYASMSSGNDRATEDENPAWQTLHDLREAERRAAGERTLADIKPDSSTAAEA